MGLSKQLMGVMNALFAAGGALQLHPRHHRVGHDADRSSAYAGANVEPHMTNPDDTAQQQIGFRDLRITPVKLSDNPIKRSAFRRSPRNLANLRLFCILHIRIYECL